MFFSYIVLTTFVFTEAFGQGSKQYQRMIKIKGPRCPTFSPCICKQAVNGFNEPPRNEDEGIDSLKNSKYIFSDSESESLVSGSEKPVVYLMDSPETETKTSEASSTVLPEKVQPIQTEITTSPKAELSKLNTSRNLTSTTSTETIPTETTQETAKEISELSVAEISYYSAQDLSKNSTTAATSTISSTASNEEYSSSTTTTTINSAIVVEKISPTTDDSDGDTSAVTINPKRITTQKTETTLQNKILDAITEASKSELQVSQNKPLSEMTPESTSMKEQEIETQELLPNSDNSNMIESSSNQENGNRKRRSAEMFTYGNTRSRQIWISRCQRRPVCNC